MANLSPSKNLPKVTHSVHPDIWCMFHFLYKDILFAGATNAAFGAVEMELLSSPQDPFIMTFTK